MHNCFLSLFLTIDQQFACFLNITLIYCAILSTGDTTYDCSEVLDVWKQTFSTLFSSSFCHSKALELSQIHFCICPNESNNILINKSIHLYEVELALEHAKLNKEVGIDGLPNESFIKHFLLVLLQSYSIYVLLIHLFLLNGVHP